jgi:hypothetical protein
MSQDPIVEEVRAIRDAFAKRHNYDIDAIVQALRQASVAEGRQLVSLPPKRIEEADMQQKAS